MKLLIITQAVDERDPVLGFMLGWIAEFAKHCEAVTAIGLSVGTYDLPKNVRVFSLGKEGGRSRMKYLWNFYRIIIRERKHYDAVFVHMNPEYVVLGSIVWSLLGKRIGLWYAHGHTPPFLRLAERGADIIFSSTESGFRLPSGKLHVVGQGIDLVRFTLVRRVPDGNFRIGSIGRLSRTKDYGLLVDAFPLLQNSGAPVVAEIFGGPAIPEDERYIAELRNMIRDRRLEGTITLSGAIVSDAVPTALARMDLFVNMSRTGSLDKAVLEAMAAGIPVLSSNEGLRTTLSELEKTCVFKEGDTEDFAAHIRAIIAMSPEERHVLGSRLRAIVAARHDLTRFVTRITELLAAPKAEK